jgi:ABC-type branched-subunit amino acid transport system substrate-binding protein/ABC-type amino acid transport substrate-binding protein
MTPRNTLPGLSILQLFRLPETRAAVTLLSCLLSFFAGSVLSQSAGPSSAWDMRVCVQRHNYPASSQDRPGYDNRIAELLAEELGARVSFVWALPGEAYVQQYLYSGECDMFIGVAEDAAGMVNTVPYYRAPFVFLYRADSPFEITSLADETLAEVRIATYPGGLPHVALLNRGYGESVRIYPPVGRPGGLDRDEPILTALMKGEVDVAVIYGPIGGNFARNAEVEYEVVPVTPEIEPPLIQLYRTWTIGVRPGDEHLRDRLNIALASKWEEIQAVFAEYNVPLLSTTRPFVPDEPEDLTRVAVISPSPTGLPLPTDTLGEAARLGVLLADSELGQRARQAGFTFEVLHANAPNAEAARRAAERLAVTEDVMALVGGFGPGQAEEIGDGAAERRVVFLNAGSIDQELRERCLSTTFHVEASAAMYLDALVEWHSREGDRRWFLVHEDSERGGRLRVAALRSLETAGVTSEGLEEAAVSLRQRVFGEVFERIEAANPNRVLVLLPLETQEFFLSQFESYGFDIPVTLLPAPMTQTREFMVRLRQAAPIAATGVRAALWDTSLEQGPAGELTDHFMSRTGQPMDPAAWAVYAALSILLAATEAGVSGTEELIRFLEAPESRFEVGKELPVSFRPWDHQLRQALYLVRIDPEAAWGHQVSEKAAFASVLATLPDAPGLAGEGVVAALDALGLGPDELACDF